MKPKDHHSPWRSVMVYASAMGVLAIGCATAARGAALSCTPFDVQVPAGLQLQRTADQVAQTALAALSDRSPIPCIERIIALRSVRSMYLYEPAIGRPGPGYPDVGAVWLVRARGHFTARHGVPGAPRMSADSGFFVILDVSGSVVGMGLP